MNTNLLTENFVKFSHMAAITTTAASLLLVSTVSTSATPNTPPPLPADNVHNARAASKPQKLGYFPVRGKHNTGYDKDAGKPQTWTCGNSKSNSDFNSKHLGIDIWAAQGTPVVATVSGTVTQAEYNSYGGNRVTIKDGSGWSHYSAHMQRLASGLKKGQKINAGKIIGYVGKTGTSSNGVVHLHYSIYPGDNYNKGTNPWPYLYAVERDVCKVP
jgi:murein DD-endopeptidase MepM/ murein hydrolase activator NlpD